MMLPRWEDLPSPRSTQIPPEELSRPSASVVRVKVKFEPGRAMIDFLDMLEDTEFEYVLSLINRNRAAIRLLERELQEARAKSQAEAADKATNSRDPWDFM